jgi:hypothetical protein
MHRCERCGDCFVRKDYLVKHLRRKHHCQPAHSQLSTAELLAVLVPSEEPSKREQCMGCARFFKNKESLRVHRCRNCKGQPGTDGGATAAGNPAANDTVEQLQELREELRKVTQQLQQNHKNSQHIYNDHNDHNNHNQPNINLGNQNSHNTTNNINSNTNNVIIVNGFGQESLDHITIPFLDQCLRRRDKGLIELIEKIHFDPDHRENRNVRATNVKAPVMQIHDGCAWRYGRKSKVLNDIVDKGHGMMQEHLDDNEERIRSDTSEYMFRHIQDWMEKMQDRDKRTLEDVLVDIYVLILNNNNNNSDHAAG